MALLLAEVWFWPFLVLFDVLVQTGVLYFLFFPFLLAQQQGNMCHFTAAGQIGSCYFLQLSGGSWNGFIAGGSCVSSPSEVDERSNG